MFYGEKIKNSLNHSSPLILLVYLLLIFSIILISGKVVIESYKSDALGLIKNTKEKNIEFVKKLTKDRLDNIIQNLDLSEKEAAKNLKDTIKTEVDKIDLFVSREIKRDTPKSKLINILRDYKWDLGDGYFFVVEESGLRVVYPLNRELEGSNVKDDPFAKEVFLKIKKVIDEDGSGFLHYKWEKNRDGVFYDKKTYVKLNKETGWIIGTGAYLEDFILQQQNDWLEKLKDLQFTNNQNNYIYVIKVHDYKGGDNFATMLSNPAERVMENKKISDSVKDAKGKEYRKEYMQNLRESGYSFSKFWYRKPTTNEQSYTLTYLVLYKKWDWILGTSIFLDDISEDVDLEVKILQEGVERNIYFLKALFLAIALVTILIASFLYRRQLDDKRELLDSNKRLKILADFSSEAIIFVENGVISDTNEAIESIFSVKKSDVIGKKVETFVLDETEKKMVLNSLIEDDLSYQITATKPNGEKIQIEIRSKKLPDPKKIVRVAFIKDLTKYHNEKKRLEDFNKHLEDRVKEEIQKRSKNEQMLIHQSRHASMGEMIGNIAHQWRQPLNALSIVLYKFQRALEDAGVEESKVEKLGEDSSRLIGMMSSTIDDFRNFFKPEKEKKTFYLKEPVNAVISMVEASFKKYKIVIIFENRCKKPILGFSNEFAQVVLNIMNNSKDAIIEKGINDGKIYIDISCDVKYVNVSISDNGGGIKDEYKNKIFDPYFTTKHEKHGTGIGLYMSKTIIEEHMNGKFSVSNTAEGAKFLIEMPIYEK